MEEFDWISDEDYDDEDPEGCAEEEEDRPKSARDLLSKKTQKSVKDGTLPYKHGYSDGYREGLRIGKQEGYSIGYNAALKECKLPD